MTCLHSRLRSALFFLTLLSVIASGTGCGGGKNQTPDSDNYRAAQGGKVYGGLYSYNDTGDLSTLDPVQIGDVVSHHATHQMFDLLVELGQKDLKLIPELASRWDISPDGLTYTFHLQTDVRFHDDACFSDGKGKKFTARDVKYSLERACNPATLTKGFTIFQDKVAGATAYYQDRVAAKRESRSPKVVEVSGFQVANDSTFVIKLEQPFGPFLVTMASAFCYVTCKEAVEHYKENFRVHPVGTGAFQFEEYKDGQYLLMKRNPHYWQRDESGNQLPFLDKVKLVFIRDLKTQMMELRSGKLGESYRIDQSQRSEWLSPDGTKIAEKYAKEFVYQFVPALTTQFYGMNTKLKPFDDKRVRQAFNHAVDRDKIAKYVMKGEMFAAQFGLVPPTMPGYNAASVKGYAYNPEKAKKLLAEAGYPEGKDFPKITLQFNPGGGRNELPAQAVQAMLKENLNIDVALSQVDFAQHLEMQQTSRAIFFREGWIADYPDAENFLNKFYGKLVPDSLYAASYPNTTRYVNPKFDALYEKALATTNDSLRNRLYEEAERLAIEDAPQLIIANDLDERIISIQLRDYPVNAMDRRDFKAIWWDRLSAQSTGK